MTTLDKNSNIAKIIWHDAFQRSPKPFGWGLDLRNIRVIENGTAFHVQGKVKGWIKVQLKDNHYNVVITPDEDPGSEVLYEFVSLDNLVSLVDANVRYGISSHDYICSILGFLHNEAV